MKDLTDELTQEHETIKVVLKTLTKMVDQSKITKDYNVNDVEDIVDFLTEFIHKNHFKKEELLFDFLSSVATKTEIEEFNNLSLDHRNERRIVKEIVMTLDKCNSISPCSCQMIIDEVKMYIDQISSHIEKEDTQIFPLIVSISNGQEQLEISNQIEKIQNQIFIKKNVLYYQLLAKRLEEKYLLSKQFAFYW